MDGTRSFNIVLLSGVALFLAANQPHTFEGADAHVLLTKMADFDYSTQDLLRSSRTILRPIVLKDAEDVFQFRGDYEVVKYNSGVVFESLDQAKELILSMLEDYDQKKSVRWGITVPSASSSSSSTQESDTTPTALIPLSLPIRGMVGFNYWHRGDHRASVGLELHRDYWGQGLMTEALTEVIQFGFDKMQLNRIEADVSVYHEKSLALLKRLFFVIEGVEREQYYENGTYHDLVKLSLLKKDWEQEAHNNNQSAVEK